MEMKKWEDHNYQFTKIDLADYQSSTGVEEDIVEESQEDTWTILDALNIAVKRLDANTVTPAEYFNILKSQKHKIDSVVLNKSYDNCLQLADKYAKLGQVAGLRRIGFQLSCIIQERKLIEAGITTYVYKDDLMKYIKKISDKSVRVCLIKDYEREIPDEVTEVVLSVKDIFDDFVVVYTDYTTKETERTNAVIKAKEKDPIIFGIFQDKEHIFTLDRLYYVADWVDEYCDLTLDKFVQEYQAKTGEVATRKLATPLTLSAIKEKIALLDTSGDKYKEAPSKPKNFFQKIQTFFSR